MVGEDHHRVPVIEELAARLNRSDPLRDLADAPEAQHRGVQVGYWFAEADDHMIRAWLGQPL